MEKTELLKLMNKKQLLKIIEAQHEEIENIKNSRNILDVTLEEKNNLIANLQLDLSTLKFSVRRKETLMKSRLDDLEFIADQFNRSLGCTKEGEIINLQSQSNIKMRLEDRFEKTGDNKNIFLIGRSRIKSMQ